MNKLISRSGLSDPQNTTFAHNILFLKILKDVAAGCAARGMAILAIKGSALLGKEYTDLSSRRMTDVDVLVRRSDFSSAERVLLELGARRAPGENVLHERSYERLYYLTSGTIRVAIDLHHAFVHPRAYPIDYERVFADAEPHPLEDLSRAGVRRASPEHSLLVLALHQLYDAFPAESRNFHDGQRILECNRVDPRRLAAEAERWRAVSVLHFFLARGGALQIIVNSGDLLAELPLSRVRRTAMRMLLDPVREDPFRVPFKSKRARQIVLFYLFCHGLGPAARFPLHILGLKTGALLRRMFGVGGRKPAPKGTPPAN